MKDACTRTNHLKNTLQLSKQQMIKNQKKRYKQFLATNHGTLTEPLTNLNNTVKKQKQQPKERNDTPARIITNDEEQLCNNASAETNNTQNSGTNTNIEPNSVTNNLSD